MNQDIQDIINKVVAQEEARVGHAFDGQGGRGLSMFCTIHTSQGKFRAYGNGVVADELEEALRKKVPGFKYLTVALD